MTRINLSDDDLAANREGRLSDKQRNRVHLQRLAWISGTVGLVGVVIGLAAVLFLKLQIFAFANRGELFVVIPILLFWLWVLRHTPRHWHQANLTLKSGRVSVIEGSVQTDVDFGFGVFRPVRYTIHLNSSSFRIPKALYRSFKPGHIYRI